MDWYVVHMRGGCERATAARLQQELQVDVYVPEIWRRRGGELCLAPLFPGYIFVAGADLAAKAAIIDRTPGCGRVLHRWAEDRGIPASLPGELIDSLRRVLAEAEVPADRTGPQRAHALCPQVGNLWAGTLAGRQAPAARIVQLLQAAGAAGAESETSRGQAPAVLRIRRTRGRARRPA
jgi:hypothetical protein